MSESPAGMGGSALTYLSELRVYPLKSGRGISVPEAELTPLGLRHDRRFMLVDDAGLFLTQRQYPQMARLSTAIQGDRLRIGFDDQPALEIPLAPREGTRRSVRVFRDDVDALDLGEPFAAFFTHALGRAARLVYMPDETRRPVDPAYSRAGDSVSFADGFPYLLASESSLAELNARLERPVPMSRFRPNLVISGAAAYAEDGWSSIRIGDALFEVQKPCSRCAIITTDQDTGERASKEPLKTLAGYHTWQGKAVFCQNLICRSAGHLRVGDSVVVLT